MALPLSKNNLVLAIYGRSCVGKSTLANTLAKKLGIPVRHCGSAVKAFATDIGISTNLLPIHVHKAIDTETRRLAQLTIGMLVVEGTYLDVVLTELPQVKFLQLTCDATMRSLRFRAKLGAQGSSSTTLKHRDQEDARLRRLLYGNYPAAADWLILDTAVQTPDQLVSIILDRLQQDLQDD